MREIVEPLAKVSVQIYHRRTARKKRRRSGSITGEQASRLPRTPD